MVMIGLFTAGWNSIYCARDLALRSYYPQSLNLLRLPLECWMTYVYLLTFPERTDEFIDDSKKAPTWNAIVQQLETVRNERQEVARDWIARLHKFSHVDQLVLRAVVLGRDGKLVYRLGPSRPSCRSASAQPKR